MRNSERLRKLKNYIYENLCEGRKMKTPAPGGDITQFVYDEPKVYLGYFPSRSDRTEYAPEEAVNTAPSILIMPNGGYEKNQEEERFDRYSNIHRPKEMGQSLNVTMLFTVFQDGLRLPGFVDKAVETGEFDLSLIMEGSEDGLLTLMNWMDDAGDLLLSGKFIPETDLSVIEKSMEWGLYSDQKYIADRRPLFHGAYNITFKCHADEYNEEINNLIR